MARIAPVNLTFNSKTLWFDAGDLDIQVGDGVVVTTARGTEFGRLNSEVFEADEEQIKKLKSPLKPVKRIALPLDEDRATDLERKSIESLPIFKQMVAESEVEMNPVSVEYLFDGDKAVFYFEAEERVDFRELVRKLAAHFHVRIDMRQIGVRDEARIVGGLGHCGQELCCKRLGGEFSPVSIRMAKEQDLSLNPQKISGVCGRLMCCLRYEFEAYKDFKSRAPKYNSMVETPLGLAKVVHLDVPREIVSLKVEGEKPVRVPLSRFEEPEEGARPKKVGSEAWEDATADQMSFGGAGESSVFATSQLTGCDKLATPAAHSCGGCCAQKQSRNNTQNNSKKRGKNANQPASAKIDEQASSSGRKPRRRSTKVGGAESAAYSNESQKRSEAPRNSQRKGMQPSAKKQQASKRTQQDSVENQKNTHQNKNQKQKTHQQKQQSQGPKSGPRPGQKSSALRQQNKSPKQNGAAAQNPRQKQHEQREGSGSSPTRRPRRRTHKAGSGESGTPTNSPSTDS